ncbi:MAG: glycosyltransferase family 2 protein [Propionibacteriaceae bacterium]
MDDAPGRPATTPDGAPVSGPDGSGAPEDEWQVEDPWAWAGIDAEEDLLDLSGHRVTAVLVSHDAAAWLPRTLDALATLTRRPDEIIAVDNESRDASADLLRSAVDEGTIDTLITGQRDFGFGAAVAHALVSTGQPAAGSTDWVWLLHDDVEVRPDTLEKLLVAVTREPSIEITGPKLVLVTEEGTRLISEVGSTISGTGRRELGLEPGELDQGQHDRGADTLGVSTCAMLVRRDVWDSLGGLAPEMPIFRDGVEFGWRAALAGHRVATAPGAEAAHLQAGRAGLRPDSAAGTHPDSVDRQLGLTIVAAHSTGAGRLGRWLRLVWGCLLRALGLLLGKAPGRAGDELRALGGFVGGGRRTAALRRRIAEVASTPESRAHAASLRPPWWHSWQVGLDATSTALTERRLARDDADTSLDELTGDDFAGAQARGPRISPLLVTVVLAVLASLVAARSVFGSGHLTGPALLPAPDRWLALLDGYLAPVTGAPDLSGGPWLGWLFLGSGVLAGQPDWLVTVLICGCVPLALLPAYGLLGHLVDDTRIRIWAAVGYALLPVLLGGTNQGRLSLSVVAVVLPLLVGAVRSLVLRRPGGEGAWRGAWGAGLALTVLVSFEPVLLPLAVLGGIVLACTVARQRRKIGRIGIALAVPLVVLSPWWPSVVHHWGRILVGPDAALGSTPPAPAVWHLLLGRDVGPGLPPLWITAVVLGSIWLIALVGLLLRTDSRAVRAGFCVALVGFAAAVLVSRTVVSLPPAGTEVRPAVAALLLVGFAGLLAAGSIGVDRVGTLLAGRSFGLWQPITVVTALVAVAAVLLGCGWWVVGGLAGPLERDRMEALPPYVRNAMAADTGVRTLAVDLTDAPDESADGGAARYFLLEDDQPRLGDAERGYALGMAAGAEDEVHDLVLRLVAGTADEQIAPDLSALGVAHIWVRGASTEQYSRIDNTPGLGTGSGDETGQVWSLPTPSRHQVAVLDDTQAEAIAVPGRTEGTVTLPAADSERVFRLAEAADPRWRAWLDDTELEPVDDPSGLQVFSVPPSAGTLRYALDASGRGWIALAQLAAVLVLAVLAAPSARRRETSAPVTTARRAAGLSSGGPKSADVPESEQRPEGPEQRPEGPEQDSGSPEQETQNIEQENENTEVER